jgi:hypothetical protein
MWAQPRLGLRSGDWLVRSDGAGRRGVLGREGATHGHVLQFVSQRAVGGAQDGGLRRCLARGHGCIALRADAAEVLEQQRLEACVLEFHVDAGGVNVANVDHQRETLTSSAQRTRGRAEVLGFVVRRGAVVVLRHSA